MPDDVLAGFQSLWNQAGAGKLITGGLYAQQQQSSVVPPYAVIKVSEGDRERLSGSYLQPFRVEIAVYEQPSSGKDMAAYPRLLAVVSDNTSALVVPNADRVVQVRALAGKLELLPEPRNAEEVLAAGRAWEVLIEATTVQRPT